MIHPWKKNKQKLEYDCGFFQVQVHQSASPITGKEYPFYVLETRNWTNVVALTKDQKILMVSQYRHGSEAVSLEIPGGAVDPQEEPLKAAQRELREETGYESAQWFSLGQVRPNPAILSNTCFLYLALDVQHVCDLNLDDAEELEVSLHDLHELPQLVRKGQIHHSLVIAAFHLLDLFQKEHPQKFK